MCLAHAVKKHRDIVKAYLVIEGEGWTLKELYLQRPPYDRNDGLSGFLKNWSNVEIVDLKGFEERLKAGKL